MLKHLPTILLSAVFATSTPVLAEDLKSYSAEVKVIDEEAVQPQIDKQVEDLRKNIIVDAVDAVVETNHALIALENDKSKEAIASIKKAIGKLEITLEREPGLGLKPLHVMKRINDLQVDPNLIQPKINTAQDLLKEGNLQQARVLLAPLVSEMNITITSIPLGSYPEMIRAVVPMIDEGKIDEAKLSLRRLLSTLVVKDMTLPLPPLRAEALLLKAEKLAENESRTDDENKTLTNTFQEARNQLKIAEWLGYGDKNSFGVTYDQLNEIEKKIAGGKGGKGWFDNLKGNVKNIFSK